MLWGQFPWGYRRNKFFEGGVKNKSTIINILLGNIFSNNKNFCSYKNLEDDYKNNIEKNQFETSKRQWQSVKIVIKLGTMKQL